MVQYIERCADHDPKRTERAIYIQRYPKRWTEMGRAIKKKRPHFACTEAIKI
jgi:hypothetical protein